MLRILEIFLYLAWTACFALEILGIARENSALSQTRDQIQSASFSLSQDLKEISALIKQTEVKSEELEFLHGLLNIFPQDKGYLRTQKVISDDVQTLRKELGRKLSDKLHIVVDTKTNKLFLRKGLEILWQADCSVGRGGILKDPKTGRRWEFVTPRGEFKILSKIRNKIWTKPDWAFVESGEPIPPPDDPARKVEGELGACVLDLGDGYLIHGTKNEQILGTAVSHGCVRLGAENLEKLYQMAPIGTRVYIY